MIRTLLLVLLSCNVLTKYVVIAQQQQLEPSIMKVDKIAEKLENETCKGKIQTYKSCRFNDKLEVYEKKSGQTFHILSKVAKGFDIPKGCKVTLFSKIGNTHTILGNSKDSQAIVIKGPKQRYCSESHLDNIVGIGIEDDADVSEVVEGFKQFAKVVSSIDKHMRQTDDAIRKVRKGILGNSDAIIQNSLTCTYSQKQKFLREFKFQEDNRKQEIKNLIEMKETFKKTTCCVRKAQEAYKKDLFFSDSPSGNGCGHDYGVDTPPNAVCVPNYKSFYGKRCTVGEAGYKSGINSTIVYGYKGGDLGGISKENTKKLASAIGVNGITDVECLQVNGKDWLNKKDWLKKDATNTKFITSLSVNCQKDLFFDASSKPYFKHELCHRLVTCKNVDDEIGENFKIKCAIKGNSTKTGKEIKKQVTCQFNFDCHIGVYREPICDIVKANVNDIKDGRDNVRDDPIEPPCMDESGQFNSTKKLCLITKEYMPLCAVKRKNSKAKCDAFSHFNPLPLGPVPHQDGPHDMHEPPSRSPHQDGSGVVTGRSLTRRTLLNDVLLNRRRRKLLRNSQKGC